jgi:nudix-type nucleoside diphosphatase (YffH/AdpP family)
MSERINIRSTEVLHQSKYTLKKVTFETGTHGKPQTHEVYHRGNAAAILLYNKESKTVVLTRQFRLPSFLNGNDDGMLIEVCAGMLDGDDPATCARREAVEETGYKVEEVQHAFDTYTSPGGVTEMIHCFVAAYTPEMKVSKGGGLPEEGEKIELLEPTLDTALHMIDTGAIRDGKTIMLLQYAKLHNLV